MTDLPRDVLGQRAASRLETCRSEYVRAQEIDLRSAEHVDRIILVGGAAAILASVTFLKDIAPTPAPGTIFLLQVAWALLLAGGAAGVASLDCSRRAARLYSRILRRRIEDGTGLLEPTDYDPMRRWNTATRWCTIAGLSLFGSGLLFLVLFANSNLPAEMGSDARPQAQPAIEGAPSAGA